MSKPANNHIQDPARALSVGVMLGAAEECEFLGDCRFRQLMERGSEWSKYARNWGMVRRMVMWLHSNQFSMMTDELGYNEEVTRAALLQKMAGIR